MAIAYNVHPTLFIETRSQNGYSTYLQASLSAYDTSTTSLPLRGNQNKLKKAPYGIKAHEKNVVCTNC